MKTLVLLWGLLLSVTADAAIQYTPGRAELIRNGVLQSPNYATFSECDAAIRTKPVPAGPAIQFRCRQTTVARFVANPPPPPGPVDCVVSAYGAWVSGAWSACAGGTQSRTETRTRTVVTPAANGGVACPALSESRTVTQSCTIDPPPPPPAGDTLGKLLNFAETWDRNWNFGGHTVTSLFNENYGKWDYTESTYEPWLFDRATVGYRLFELTGNTRWRDKFLADFAYYRAHIDSQGIFTPKGADDTKYGYVTPFVLYERVTSDQQYRPIAKRIYDSWVREWNPNFLPGPGAQLWTEREMAFALEAAVSYYELTGDTSALARAGAIVRQWTVASGGVGAPLTTYTQHEGGGPGGTTPQNLTNSPWMSALYFQAARRYYEITNSAEVIDQASKYADWCDANCFYDAALAHPEFSGLVFPRYLTGALIGDAGYDEGNMGHCLDVGGLLKFALFAKQQRGGFITATQARYTQMQACADRDFQNWTRSTTYLPKYRISPPRKFNWQLRGFYEDSL